jgi:ribosomal protein L34E
MAKKYIKLDVPIKDISNQKIRQAINTNKCPTCGAILHSLNPLFNHGRHGGLECGNCR